MTTLDTYIGNLADLPIAQAAAGDPSAQQQIACAFYASGKNGLMSFDEALTVALILGRMAASHGGADACYAMSIFLAHHAERAPDNESRDIRGAEAVAWLHRAAEAGHVDADKEIEAAADNGDLAPMLATAAKLDRAI